MTNFVAESKNSFPSIFVSVLGESLKKKKKREISLLCKGKNLEPKNMNTHTLRLALLFCVLFVYFITVICNIDSMIERPKASFMILMFSFYHSPIFFYLSIHCIFS